MPLGFIGLNRTWYIIKQLSIVSAAYPGYSVRV